MLTSEQVKAIICKAVSEKLLILVQSDEAAVKMREDVTDYLKSIGLGHIINRFPEYGVIEFSGGYENITILTADMWNNRSKRVFKGTVYISNRAVGEVKNISSDPRMLAELFAEGL